MKGILDRFLKSLQYASSGFLLVFRTQPNMRIHGVAAMVVVGLGGVFRLSSIEWAILVFAIGQVWVTEMLNTAVEFLGDAISLEHHDLIGKAKDVGAAATLTSAVLALVLGLLVFVPHLVHAR